TTVNGQAIQSVESGVLDSKGQITLMMVTANNPMVVARFAADGPHVLFQAGDTVQTQVPTVMGSFIPGSRNGNPMFLAGSAGSASIAEWRNGNIEPILTAGDRVLGAPPYGGANTSVVQRTANGDLYTTISPLGVVRYSGGQW